MAFPKFEEIRREGRLCDITLITPAGVGQEGSERPQHRFSAHRIVLAATIPYFRAMFCSDMVEQFQNEILIQGWFAHYFAILLFL